VANNFLLPSVFTCELQPLTYFRSEVITYKFLLLSFYKQDKAIHVIVAVLHSSAMRPFNREVNYASPVKAPTLLRQTANK
jgi:hypothetical protein